eukprot:Gregarina_sp_Poly_1__687@NODE_1163_length_4887_cov_131_620332_g798_i0_p6_GENE_NODE_1163_length_4887_cov_131_620332_g798_i0NODE_1163_length_4887_cov_131_620332_g798_i0_p6_ORF_typecomplete_len102_score4_82_NODE_1163_length_4887_cov_131_620332_g798_i030493354
MFATFLAHLTVVVAVSHGPAIGNGYYATSVGTIRSAAAFQPAISAVLVILWSVRENYRLSVSNAHTCYTYRRLLMFSSWRWRIFEMCNCQSLGIYAGAPNE